MPQSDFHHPFNQKNHPCLQFIRAKNSKVTAEQVANDDEFDSGLLLKKPRSASFGALWS